MALLSHYNMMVGVFIGILALLGGLLFFYGVRSLWRHRFTAGSLEGLTGLLLLAVAGLLVAVAMNLQTYNRLTHEAPVAEIHFQRRTAEHFWGYLTLGRAEAMVFDMRGDEWQLDARILKWKGIALLLGFDTLYRLDRLGGRYRDIVRERTLPRSVYSLAGDGVGLEIWTLAQRFSTWVPLVDAVYGNSAYVPMADGARFVVSISASGLVARPGNSIAERAVRRWR